MADNIKKDESQDKGNPLTRFLAEGLKASFAGREYTPEEMKEIESQGAKVTKTSVKKYGRQPSDYTQSSYVRRDGQVVPNQDGGASFYFTLPDPSGSGTLVDRPAALLPGGMGYFYVKGLEDAASEFESTYTYKSQLGGPSIQALKEKLWMGRYMDDLSYIQSIRPGTKDIIDPSTSAAIFNMLNDVSVSNKRLLETGNMNIQGWEDFVNTNYQQEIKTGGSVNVPSDDKLNFAINNVFQTYYNRDATEVEAANLREQIKSAAFASPRIESEYKDPVTGLTLDVTSGGFDETDIANLLVESTEGKRPYWALQQFGDAFNSVMSQDAGSLGDFTSRLK
jgi:hypothetical protein